MDDARRARLFASATEALSENEKLIFAILHSIESKGRRGVSSSEVYEVLARYLAKRGNVIGIDTFYNLLKRMNTSGFLKIKRKSNPIHPADHYWIYRNLSDEEFRIVEEEVESVRSIVRDLKTIL